MQQDCPFTMSKCLDIINGRLRRDGIPFVNPRDVGKPTPHKFNSFAWKLFVKFYDAKANPQYCYCYDRQSAPTYTYSQRLIDMIIEQIKKDPEHIVQSLKDKVGKSTPGAKDF